MENCLATIGAMCFSCVSFGWRIFYYQAKFRGGKSLLYENAQKKILF